MDKQDLTQDFASLTPPDVRDSVVVDAVKNYMKLLDAGTAQPLDEFLRRYADISSELRPALEGLALVHRAAEPKRGGAVATSPDAEFTSKPIGDFQIVGELGRGGMGVVYEAIQLSLGRRVALKVLPFASGLNAVRLQRFRNEAHAAAALHHTNIVPVYAVGTDRGVHYYAMQLIDGHTIAEMIDNMRATKSKSPSEKSIVPERSTTSTPERNTSKVLGVTQTRVNETSSDRLRYYQSVTRIIHQAALALEHAHQYGVIHRDIKPANLLLDATGKVWVTDFGLAQVLESDSHLTRTGDPMGTLRYMSPEQAVGNRAILDHRTDIYSLGITLYEMLTLEPAIRDAGYREMLNQVAEHDPIPPKTVDPWLPSELDTIIRKAISKSPNERYETAGAFADDLQRWLDDKPIAARAPTTLERLNKWRRRNSGLVAAISVVLLIATFGLLATTLMVWSEQQQTILALDRETQQRQLAEQSFRQARQAVDTFNNLSESELAYRPELQDLRRSLLETSLTFYSDFLEQRKDDPGLAVDLATTSARVERMVDELRVLDNMAPLLLLSSPGVQAELAIETIEADEIAMSVSRFQLDRRGLANQNVGGITSENTEMTDLLQELDLYITERLSPTQLTRLRQIARQQRLPFTFKTAEVIAALGLSRQQRESINRIIEATRPNRRGPLGAGREDIKDSERGMAQHRNDKDHRLPHRRDHSDSFAPDDSPPDGFGPPHDGPPPDGYGGGDGPPDFMRDMAWSDATANTLKHILETLTPEQKVKWVELIGAPFNPTSTRPSQP